MKSCSKKLTAITWCALCLAFTTGPAQTAHASVAPAWLEESPAQYRGYTEINRALKESLILPESDWQLGRYLSERRSEPSRNGGLLPLLGTYAGTDLGGGFKNGGPNAMNMLLWYVAFSGFAVDMGNLCNTNPAPPQPLPLNAESLRVVQGLCSWPSEGARSDAALLEFWLMLVGFDVPMTEFDAWKTFVTTPEMLATRSSLAIRSMVVGALYNPHYLLRK